MKDSYNKRLARDTINTDKTHTTNREKNSF